MVLEVLVLAVAGLSLLPRATEAEVLLVAEVEEVLLSLFLTLSPDATFSQGPLARLTAIPLVNKRMARIITLTVAARSGQFTILLLEDGRWDSFRCS
jgi:hypothetical protein